MPLLLAQPLHRDAKNRKVWVWGIALAVLIVYIAGISSQWWVGKDGALYLCLGRNLSRGLGYTLAGQAHTVVPPGYPAMLAGLMWVGAESFLAMNIVMAVMGLTTAAVAYFLLRQLVHPDWALLGACVFALSNELFQRSGEILADVPFTLLVLAGIALYLRGLRQQRPDRSGWEIGSLLLVGACWIRMAGFPLVVGAGIGLALSGWNKARRRSLANLAIVLLGCLATVGAFYYYARADSDPNGASYLSGIQYHAQSLSIWGRLTTPLQRIYEGSRDLSRLLIAQKMPGAICILLLVLPITIAMIRRIAIGDRVGPLAVIFYVGAMCAAMVRIRTRYLLPVSPLLVLYLLEGHLWISARLWKHRSKSVRTAVIAIAIVILGFNLVIIARNIVEKHSDNYATLQQNGKWRDLPATVEFLRNQKTGGSIIGEYAYAYLADMQRPALPKRLRYSKPSPEELGRLLRKWDVRFVAFNTRSELIPFYSALLQYVQRSGQAVFEHGDVLIYSIEQHSSPATQASQTTITESLPGTR